MSRSLFAERLHLDLVTGGLFIDSLSVRQLSIEAARRLALALAHRCEGIEVGVECFAKFSIPVQFAGEDCRLRLDYDLATGRLDDFYVYWMGGTARAKPWDTTPGELRRDLQTFGAVLNERLGLVMIPAQEWSEEAAFRWGTVGLEASPKAMTIAVTFKLESSFIDDFKRSVLDITSAAFLQTHFGVEWFRHGDPRTMLALSFDDLLAFARVHGIPREVLAEDCWSGDDHFVIDKQRGKWRIGFAERGQVRLIGTAESEQAARDLVTRELFALYESAADPSHWSGGVPAGTPWGRFSPEGNA